MNEYALLQGLRILIVDDDADSYEMLAAFFGLYEAEVVTVAAVPEALDQFARFAPQLLVSDIAMPNQDGYALIQAIRALSPAQGGRIPAIALSAYADRGTQQRSIAAGFDGHVAKPIDPYELAEVMVKLLEAGSASDTASAAG